MPNTDCPLCRMLQRLRIGSGGEAAEGQRSYAIGRLFDGGALGAVWQEHGNPVKGPVPAMLLHLNAWASSDYGRDGYTLKFLVETHGHLACIVVPIENGKG